MIPFPEQPDSGYMKMERTQSGRCLLPKNHFLFPASIISSLRAHPWPVAQKTANGASILSGTRLQRLDHVREYDQRKGRLRGTGREFCAGRNTGRSSRVLHSMKKKDMRPYDRTRRAWALFPGMKRAHILAAEISGKGISCQEPEVEAFRKPLRDLGMFRAAPQFSGSGIFFYWNILM